MPVVSTRTTVPAKPSSATTRLDPPPSDEERLVGVVDLVDRVDELVGRGDPDQPVGRPADPHRRQRREVDSVLFTHPGAAAGQSSWTTASARPSTLSPLLMAVSSTVARFASASTALTTPSTATSAPPS